MRLLGIVATVVGVLSVSVVLATGCGKISETTKVVTLYPIGQWGTFKNSAGFFSSPFCHFATGKLGDVTRPPAGGVLVGWDNHYDDGFCWEKDDYAYRAAARFDVNFLIAEKSKSIGEARLKWSESDLARRDSDGSKEFGGFPCPNTVLRATAQPEATSELYPGELDGVIGASGEYDALQLVQDWVLKKLPNNGVVFRGRNENYDPDNSACLSSMSKIRLVIKYTVVS